jgi:hypothetical protein
MAAAFTGRLRTVSHLLTFLTDYDQEWIHKKDLVTDKNTALEFAVMRGHLPIVKKILTFCPVIHSPEGSPSAVDYTDLFMRALVAGHLKIIRYLVKYYGKSIKWTRSMIGSIGDPDTKEWVWQELKTFSLSLH